MAKIHVPDFAGYRCLGLFEDIEISAGKSVLRRGELLHLTLKTLFVGGPCIVYEKMPKPKIRRFQESVEKRPAKAGDIYIRSGNEVRVWVGAPSIDSYTILEPITNEEKSND